MNQRWLVSSFTASSLIHLGIIPLAALVMHAKPIKPAMVPIELVDVARIEEPKKFEVASPPPPSAPKPKLQNITAPKLLSKPVFETSPLPATDNTKEEVKEKPIEQPLASLPDNNGGAKAGWNLGSKAAEAEGSAAGAGIFSAREMLARSAVAALPAVAGAQARRDWIEAPRATAPAAARAPEKHYRGWFGHSAVTKSSRAIPSQRDDRACRA